MSVNMPVRQYLNGIAYIVIGLLVNSFGPILIWEMSESLGVIPDLLINGLFPIAGYIFVFVGIFSLASNWFKERGFDWQSLRNVSPTLEAELQQAIERARAEPEKTKPAWDLARVRLELYFDRNISQINYIFWLSVIVMLVGFGFILFGISQTFVISRVIENSTGQNITPTVIPISPAIVGTVAGIITEFIGATFLFIYRSTIQQAASYIKTLERINSVGMAMQILDTISTDSKQLQDETKAAIVKTLLLKAEEVKSEDAT